MGVLLTRVQIYFGDHPQELQNHQKLIQDFTRTLQLGGLLAFIQSFLLWLLARQPLAGLLGQLLVLSLVGTWINNTTLTMVWFLLWDLPKAWLELMVLTALVAFPLPRESS